MEERKVVGGQWSVVSGQFEFKLQLVVEARKLELELRTGRTWPDRLTDLD